MPTLFALSAAPDISIKSGAVMIGRHPECDVRLDSLRVSRRHCIFVAEQGEIFVRDLGSTNGTWLNGRRVASGRIRPGDEVSIAHFRYYMEVTASISRALTHVPNRPQDES